MCTACYTYIKINEYWKNLFEINTKKNIYLSVDNFKKIIWNQNLLVKDMNKIVTELNIQEVCILDENISMTDNTAWHQRKQFCKYTLNDCRDGITNIIKSVGVVVLSKDMENIIGSENAFFIIPHNCICKPNMANTIHITIFEVSVLAYEY